jgi:uncharacterized protein YndB with AHSA1/START domain
MKWVLIIVAALLALVLLVLVVGSLLPVGHAASMIVHYDRPPEAVWSAITNVSAYPTWRDDVTKVEVLPAKEGRPRWIEEGSGERITFETVESDAPRRLLVRIADSGLPFGGTWTYSLTPDIDGTTLRVTENGEVYNPIFRFMSRYIFGHTATMDKFLRALGRHFGENVAPDADAD